MAARQRKEKGFYAALDRVSTVDILPKIEKRKRKTRGRLWEVERLVAQRENATGSTEYLVLWRGYSPYDCTWEPQENVSLDCIRFFENPSPEQSLLFDECATLRVAVEQHLKSKSRLPVTIKFRGDAYRRLFKNKGQIRDRYHFLEKADFPPKFFPQFWDYCADSHGQGIKVYYPMKIRHFVSWSPKKYRVEDHNPSPRAFQEKLTFSFIKVALGDTS
ncbi:uncharacterized protein LOC111332072 [Stylophora pistillata]|uniref:uncharacterized protein LOC111332072 n=1 Tax=Stylophora pistillata TaxID=50429 RepID=UPI000C047327|nr:uncharacterized protein LOC111332072 [Stylophora pistillata]